MAEHDKVACVVEKLRGPFYPRGLAHETHFIGGQGILFVLENGIERLLELIVTALEKFRIDGAVDAPHIQFADSFLQLRAEVFDEFGAPSDTEREIEAGVGSPELDEMGDTVRRNLRSERIEYRSGFGGEILGEFKAVEELIGFERIVPGKPNERIEPDDIDGIVLGGEDIRMIH